MFTPPTLVTYLVSGGNGPPPRWPRFGTYPLFPPGSHRPARLPCGMGEIPSRGRAPAPASSATADLLRERTGRPGLPTVVRRVQHAPVLGRREAVLPGCEGERAALHRKCDAAVPTASAVVRQVERRDVVASVAVEGVAEVGR